MNHPILILLAQLLAFVESTMPELRERVAGVTFQKFTDVVEDLKKVIADPGPYGITDAPPADGGLPPMIVDILTAFNAELARRAEFDTAQAAIASRIAQGVELVAERLQLPEVATTL